MNDSTPVDTDQSEHLKDLTGFVMDELGIARQPGATVTALRNTSEPASVEKLCQLLDSLVAVIHDRLTDPEKRATLTPSFLNAVAGLLRDVGVTGAVRSALARRRAAAEAVEAQALERAAAPVRPARMTIASRLPAGGAGAAVHAGHTLGSADSKWPQLADSPDEADTAQVDDGVDHFARFRTGAPVDAPGAVTVDGTGAPPGTE